MRYFKTKKRVDAPKYQLYSIIFTGVFVFILFFFLLVHFLLSVGQNTFLNIFWENAFGYHETKDFSSVLDRYAFGFWPSNDSSVIKEDYSLEDVVVQDLKEVVYIYNTFQTDTYKSNYFYRYSLNSYVTQASLILSEYLKREGIGSFVETSSVVEKLKEEDILYTNSYRGSRILLEEAKKQIPSLQYYFDLQLSDATYQDTTVEIEGESYAKILFVVGTDNAYYEENQKFAQQLNQILEEKYPTLSRGVSLRGGEGYQGVYNQDYSSHVLLIQVGGVNNTIDEANRSLSILAEVIATYIEEEYLEEE